MNFLLQELDIIINGQQSRIRSVVLSVLSTGLTFLVAKLSLSRFATPDEILSWSTLLTGAIVTGAIHFLDRHIGNAHVPTDLAAQNGAPSGQPAGAVTPPSTSQPDSSAKQ